MVRKSTRRADPAGELGIRSMVAIAAVLLLALPAATAGAHEPGSVAAAESATKQVAQVKVEVKTEGGRVVKGDAQLDWGEHGNVELDADGHKHTVGLELARPEGDAKTLTVTLRYHVDDRLVVAPYTFDTTVKKREVLHIEGGTAIALTVTPKKVKAPPPEEEKPKDKIEVGGEDDPDDPLGGLQK